MREAITRHFIQQGSSQDICVSDENAWYVIRQVWPDAHGSISQCEIETKCDNRDEAIRLAELYNSPPETLGALAEWSNVSYDTLKHAARSDPPRIRAFKSGRTWMSTRRDVTEYQASLVLKPRRTRESE